MFDEIITCLNDNCVTVIQEERKDTPKTKGAKKPITYQEETMDHNDPVDNNQEFASTHWSQDEEAYSSTQYINEDEEYTSTQGSESSIVVDTEQPKEMKENKVLVENKAVN